MNSKEIARLVEFSEARAYQSLVGEAAPGLRETHDFGAVRLGSAVAVFAGSVRNTLNVNRVIGLGVDEPATESMIDEIGALYGGHGASFGVEAGPEAQPAELREWLRARRIRRGMNTAIHYRRAEAVAGTPRRVSVIRAGPDERGRVADICCSVFRMDPAVHALIAGAEERAGWRHWLGYSGGEPVAAALSFVRDRVGWLGWDATLPGHRGKGAQSAMIADRVSDAAAAGCDYVTTETAVNTEARTDPSYANYARLGFALAYERTTYVAMRRPPVAAGLA